MSTTTDPTPPSPPTPSFDDAIALNVRQIETAPSQTMVQGPGFARMVGFVGLFAVVLGAVVVITNMALTPRWITTGWGYLFCAVGVVLLMYHAVSDTEQEIRRMYGLFSALLLVLGLIAGIAPGPVFTAATNKVIGFNLLPWGVGFGMLSLVFAIPFARQETDRTYRSYAELGMLGIGVALAGGSLLAGLFKPDFLLGPGIALALLGLGFLAAYMGQVDTSEGIGYQVAFALGAVGAAVAVYALAKSTVPTLLYDGPNVLRKPNGSLDWWRVAARGLAFALLGGIGYVGFAIKNSPLWLRSTLMALGGAGVLVLLVATFSSNTITTPPGPFLIPYGMILLLLGVMYLAMAMAICSDNKFITLTRRELAAYFLSPIGYLVLAGMIFIHWNSYREFVNGLAAASRASEPMQEPIVRGLFIDFLPVIALMLMVPALTMRLVSEEKRTGSLEMLLTAPVNELPIILSKFLATWLFFMACWIPLGLFLIPLRIQVDQSFDYKPLLSFYVALGAQGLAFVAMGLFFSAMTKNQIVAAVLTLVGMLIFFISFMIRRGQLPFGVPEIVQTVLGRFSYIHMWIDSLSGQLPLRDVLLFVSLAVFFLFLSVKILEARKWN